MSSLTKDILDNILTAAVCAPSGDNVQPARFEVSAGLRQIDLFNMPERDPSYFNYLQLASYVAHGAIIENFLIAARVYGFDVNLKVFPSDDMTHTARFELMDVEPEVSPWYEAIFKRCTNRNMYRRGSFDSEQKQAMLRAVEGIKGVTLSLIDNPEQKNALARQLAVNDRMVFEHKEIHSFLFKQIRWNKKQIEDTKDGMPIGTLGLNPIEEKVFFPLLRFWAAVKIFNLFGLSRIIGFKGFLGCRSAMAVGMISTTLPGKEGFLASGRAFQRVWLEATRQGMAFQPVTGITFLMQRLQDDELEGFNAKQKGVIMRAEASMRDAFDAGDRVMSVGFRVGYQRDQAIKTERRLPVITEKK